jgi:SagB-type dehydrogenase family enzyme
MFHLVLKIPASYVLTLALILIWVAVGFAQATEPVTIPLPSPRQDSNMSVEKAISHRRSVRDYAEGYLSLGDISQILWAAQGFTQERKDPPRMWNQKYEWQGGLRTAPSAGALYPMEVYVLAGKVEGLDKGVYKYIPKTHSLKKIMIEDKRLELSDAALEQPSIESGAAVLVLAGVYDRTSYKYGDRAERYVHIETGSIAENISLQCVALGLGTVLMGAFKDDEVKKVLQMPEDERPLLIMPLGRT